MLLYMFSIADNDECADGTDVCSANATCYNTDGGYNCSCNSGYEGDGVNCSSKHFDKHCGPLYLTIIVQNMCVFLSHNICTKKYKSPASVFVG